MACEGGCCDNEVNYDSCHHSDTNNDGIIIVTDGLSLHDTLLRVAADDDSDDSSWHPSDTDSSSSDSDDSDLSLTGSWKPYYPCERCWWWEYVNGGGVLQENNSTAELMVLANQATRDLGGSVAVIDLSGTSSQSAERIWNNPRYKEGLQGVRIIGGVGPGNGTYHPSTFGPGRPLIGRNYPESCYMKTINAKKLSIEVKELNNELGFGPHDNTEHGRLLSIFQESNKIPYVRRLEDIARLFQNQRRKQHYQNRRERQRQRPLDSERPLVNDRKQRDRRLTWYYPCSAETCTGVTKGKKRLCYKCRRAKRWNDHLAELEVFKRENGHCIIPRSGALGGWVHSQRVQYKLFRAGKQSPITEDRIRKLEQLGFTWDAKSSAWEDHLAELEVFKRENGHCIVPQSGGALGDWVHSQRVQYKLFRAGKQSYITEDRIRKLEQLGFTWDAISSEWEDRFAELEVFKRENGHCTVPKRGRGALGGWVLRQRVQYKLFRAGKQSPITEDRIRKLEQLGFKWDAKSSSSAWEDHLAELEVFKRENGHCIIPRSGGALGRWVNSQRVQYKLFRAGKQSPITEDRIRKLEQLGFTWDAKSSAWEDHLAELEVFKRENGHCTVPRSGGALGRWVHSQRVQYKLFRAGKQSQITEDRIRKLEQLGFTWDAKSSAWEDHLAELEVFKRENGHCTVPRSGGALGRWVHTQRVQYKLFRAGKQSQITEDRIRKLEQLGFTWEQRRCRRSSGDVAS
eukprot:scaffold4810_cov98-Skeletonema_menzelii.AAC.1